MNESVFVPAVDLVARYRIRRREYLAAVDEVFRGGRLIGGAAVERFERDFAEWSDSAHCVSVGSGTDALKIALRALDVQPGDEVVTTSHTFFAIAEAIYDVGAIPVFADLAPGGPNVSISSVETAIGPRTRALLVVHMHGIPIDMSALIPIARAHDLVVIEDCAQAHGATVRGRKVGTFGDAGCFSFYPTKILGASGDGGAIICRSSRVARNALALRDHGRLGHTTHTALGYTSRLDAVQAALLNVELGHVDDDIARRRAIAERYDACVVSLGGVLPIVPPGCRPSYYQYPLISGDRDRLAKALVARGIEVPLDHRAPIHEQPALRTQAWRGEPLRVTREWMDSVLFLPVHPEMTDEQVDSVALALRAAWPDPDRLVIS